MEQVFPGIRCLPLRSPTLPPATHTNCWVLGDGELIIVDPASPWDDERQQLWGALSLRLDAGETIRGVFLTHHHRDHVSGAAHLMSQLREQGVDAPMIAHSVTANLVDFPVDELWDEGEHHAFGGLVVDVLHTPGHAPGHLVLHERASGAMVAGDMVAGVGTIAIDPDEGDLGDYLAHLERMRRRAPSALLPAHGPVLHQADAVLSFYIAHRNGRSDQIREALRTGGEQSPEELAGVVYPELDAGWRRLAARQIQTHLDWLSAHGMVRRVVPDRWAAE